MRSSWIVLSSALLLACGGATTEAPPPEPAPEPVVETPPASTDPIVVGPTVYSMVFENESVRINKVSFDPGETIAMHSHPDHAIYALTAGKLEITHGDGTSNTIELTPGMAAFLPAESHSARNTGDTLVEAAQVELKVPGGTAAPAGTDPLVAGPTIYKSVFENERVRIFETTFAPGAEIPMHSHPDHAAWVVTGGKLQITNAAGAAEHVLEAGQAVFMPAEAHSAKNVGETEIKLAVFELKPATADVATP
jgi:quercetin dioxygenase-like cupin family protein